MMKSVLIVIALATGPIATAPAEPKPMAAANTATVPSAQTVAPPAAVSVPWYAVDVLVFRDTAPFAGRAETWPATMPAPDLAGAVYPPTVPGVAYSAPAEDASSMTAAERRLAASGRYAIATRLGWLQPANSSRPVSLAPLPVNAPAAATAFSPGAIVEPSNPLAVRVDGTARLRIVGESAQVTLHLRLCEPAPPGVVVQVPAKSTAVVNVGAKPSTLPAAFPDSRAPRHIRQSPARICSVLNQSRAATAGRLEYFDNPLFAVLVLVREIKPPETPPATSRAVREPARSPAPD